MKVINKDFAFLFKEYVDDATQEVAELLAFKVSNSAQFFTLEDTMLGVQCMCLKSIVYVTRFQFISGSSWQGVVWSETAGSLVTCNSFYNISPDHSNNLHSISSTTLSDMYSIQKKKYLKHLYILLKILLNKDKVKTVLEEWKTHFILVF